MPHDPFSGPGPDGEEPGGFPLLPGEEGPVRRTRQWPGGLFSSSD